MDVHRLISRLLLLAALCGLAGCGASTANSTGSHKPAVKLTNVSYDPTRELYAEFNKEFAQHWLEENGQVVDDRRSRTAARVHKPAR